MASLADPSAFALSVAVGSAHVLGALDGAAARSPVAAVLLAIPVLVAYLAAVTLAFAVRVAADVCAHVAACGHGEDTAALAQAAALLSPAPVLGWLASTAAKLDVALLIFCGLAAAAAFHFGPVP